MGSAGPVSETIFLWDGANIVAELDGSTVAARYVRGIGLLMSDSSIGQKFYLYNGHGDVVQLAGSTGTILREYDYDAFGNEREIAGQDPALDANPFRYCGEYYDLETKTYYLRARYYQPTTGRFLQEDTHWHPGNMIYGDSPNDPLGLGHYVPDINAIRQSANLYAFCGNNPIIYKDSTGMVWETVFDIACTILSAYDLITDPSWANAGYLLLDIGGVLVPFVPSTGKIIKTTVNVASKSDIVIDAAKAGVKLTQAQQAAISVHKGQKLTGKMSEALRAQARTIMKSIQNEAIRAGKKFDAVHHIRPLEYAHLFPGNNPNELSNLAGVSSKVHGEINSIWNTFRRNNPNPTAQEVMNQVNAINKQYFSEFIR